MARRRAGASAAERRKQRGRRQREGGRVEGKNESNMRVKSIKVGERERAHVEILPDGESNTVTCALQHVCQQEEWRDKINTIHNS